MAVNVSKYSVSSEGLVSRLTPFFVSGKKVLRFLSAITHPMDSVNESFCAWAKTTLLDAAMTPQTITLKWYMKEKLGGYFTDPNAKFQFDSYGRSSYTSLYETASEENQLSDVPKVYITEDVDESVTPTRDPSHETPMIINNMGEIVDESVDFTVYAPAHNSSITDDEYIKLINQILSPYITNVTYNIKISQS